MEASVSNLKALKHEFYKNQFSFSGKKTFSSLPTSKFLLQIEKLKQFFS